MRKVGGGGGGRGQGEGEREGGGVEKSRFPAWRSTCLGCLKPL